MKSPRKNMGASVRQRLLDHKRRTNDNFNFLLTRYALERLLFRLSQSPQRDGFVLKGAALYAIWGREAQNLTYRPTRDLDLWSSGAPTPEGIETAFRTILGTPVEDDGLQFQLETLQVKPMRTEQKYRGCRLEVDAILAGAHIPLQVDFGFGDAITPAAHLVTFPTILPESGAPLLRAYPRETVVAEKFEALVALDMLNSRLKDFFDLWTLANHFDFEGDILRQALRNTFARRETGLRAQMPVALTPVFTEDAGKIAAWKAFGRRSEIESLPELSTATQRIAHFLWPVVQAAHQTEQWPFFWRAAQDWKDLEFSNPS